MEWFGSYLGEWLGAGEPAAPGTITATLHGSGALTGALIGTGVTPTSGLKYWTGSAWVVKPLKYWSGSAWIEKPLKQWNGSSWA